MPYSYIADIATADIAFRAWGQTLEEVFATAADATANVMVENLDQVFPHLQRTVKLQGADLELLLVQFLQELVYFKDTEKLLLRVQDISFAPDGPEISLQAVLAGEKIDPLKHKMKVDIKAVTFHRLKVARTMQGWEAVVVVDI